MDERNVLDYQSRTGKTNEGFIYLASISLHGAFFPSSRSVSHREDGHSTSSYNLMVFMFSATDDIPDAERIRSLLQDLRDIRSTKMIESFKSFQGDIAAIKVFLILSPYYIDDEN
jgi:hypothetical protein